MKRYFWSCLFVFVLLLGTSVFGETTPLAQFNAENASTTLPEIQVLSGADGFIEQIKRGGRDCIACKQGEQPPSVYLYFAVPKTILSGEGKPVYVEISYFDNKPGTPLTLEYDSARGEQITDKYCPAEEHWGGARTGSEKWKRAVFLLQQPRFAARQNLGASFRIGGGDLYVESVSLLAEPPEDVEKLKGAPPARLVSKTRIGADKSFIIGGFDIDSASALNSQLQSLQNALPALRAMGLTSHEAYVRWNLCEPEPGRYDWSLYDAYVDVYRQAGVKWVPFLIIGSPYSLPNWYYKQAGSQGYVCLEHGEESDVESLWNPVLHDHVAGMRILSNLSCWALPATMARRFMWLPATTGRQISTASTTHTAGYGRATRMRVRISESFLQTSTRRLPRSMPHGIALSTILMVLNLSCVMPRRTTVPGSILPRGILVP